MSQIHFIDVYGQEHTIQGYEGRKLMEALREHECGVTASCGGMCACATCHVFVDREWVPRIPAMHSDERELLEALTTYEPGASRLSCQITFTAQLDGIRVRVAPEE